MKTLEELKEFYQTELLQDLRLFEQKRKQIIQNTLISIGVIAVLGLIILSIIISQNAPLVIIQLFLFGLVGLSIIVFWFISRDYKAEFKQQIISKIIAFLEPGLSYQPQGLIDRQTFKASKLFNHRIDRYRGEDRVNGLVGKTKISFSEVHAESQTTTDSKGRTQTHWHTIFKGLFFIADFNKHFHGQMVVLPDTAEKVFGSFGKMLQSWNIAREDLIKLEDSEFEQEFVVYGSDQIEARYILSTSLMQRIMDFKKKTGTKIYLSFTGSKVYVALPIDKNLFEPKYMSSITDFESILDYASDLSLAIDIVDDLNLNRRIWSKK